SGPACWAAAETAWPSATLTKRLHQTEFNPKRSFAAGAAVSAAAAYAEFKVSSAGGETVREVSAADEQAAQEGLLRCIVGNPFRSFTLDSAWKTPAAVALARTAYEERRFDDMPFLADALEEAGCTDEQILSHCRGPGPHARGCWVVDLVLGKS